MNTIITQRNYERTDEIKLLKALMDKDKVLQSLTCILPRSFIDSSPKMTIEKYESELTHLKSELIAKTEILENVRISDATKTEEINNLRPYKDSLLQLQQSFQKESLERSQLQIHYDVHIKEIERLHNIVKEKENHIALVDIDSTSLRSELSELRKQNDYCEEYVSHNEKLKINLNDIKTELIEVKHRHSECNHDLIHANETIHNLNITITELTDTIDELNKKIVHINASSSNIKGVNEQLNEQLHAYRDQIKGLEGSITDYTKLVTSLQNDISEHKTLEGQYQRIIDDFVKLSTLNYDQMVTWDTHLDGILDSLVPTNTNNNSFNNSFGSTNSSSGVALFTYDLTTPVNTIAVDQIGNIKHQVGQLNQRLAVQMDRINHNFTRIIKIKTHFHTMVGRLMKEMQGKIDFIQSKNENNQDKLRYANNKIDGMKKTLERDRKQKDTDNQELLQFRQSMVENINSYTSKCVEYESKVSSLTIQLEKEREMNQLARGVLERDYASEKHKIEELLQQKIRENDDLMIQLNGCNGHITALTDNMKHINAIENQMLDLTVKVTALTVNNENLTKEIQHKDVELRQKDDEIQQKIHAHTLVLAELEAKRREVETIQQTSQREIDQLQRKLDETKLVNSQQEEKIEELSQRQVDPSLVALFKESQSLLQGFNETIQRSSGGVGSPGSVTSVDINHELSNTLPTPISNNQGSKYASRSNFSPGPVNVLPMNKNELVVSSPDVADKYYTYTDIAPRNFLMSPPTSFYNTAVSSGGLSASALASYSMGASSKYVASAKKNEEIIESAYAHHTPNSLHLSTEKMRISRIGNDLNLLAQKLDAFEKGK